MIYIFIHLADIILDSAQEQPNSPDFGQWADIFMAKKFLVAQVTSEGPAEKAGIKQGDVIREVNRKSVRDVGDFVQKIEQAKMAVVSLAQALPFFY